MSVSEEFGANPGERGGRMVVGIGADLANVSPVRSRKGTQMLIECLLYTAAALGAFHMLTYKPRYSVPFPYEETQAQN